MSRKLPLDPKLGADANVRLHQLWVDAAIITRDLQEQVDDKAPLASPTFTGTVTLPTPFTVGAVSVTATGTELNLLDGVTATTAELNILDGVTATAAELNILDGVTATAAELNILDGVTSTATELNLLDGITALAAGTYTPSSTNVASIDSSTPSVANYLRISNIVTVSGQVTLQTNDTADAELLLTLPVASNFAAAANCSGVGHWIGPSGVTQGAFKVIADATNDKARLLFYPAGTSAYDSITLTYTYTYQVI